MKKQYNAPEFALVDIDTKDIMTLSQFKSDEDVVEERDTFKWEW